MCVCSALQKACTIFSKIRGGKIFVNDLPMIHRLLKISISDSAMRNALKTINIDGKFCVFIISLMVYKHGYVICWSD